MSPRQRKGQFPFEVWVSYKNEEYLFCTCLYLQKTCVSRAENICAVAR